MAVIKTKFTKKDNIQIAQNSLASWMSYPFNDGKWSTRELYIAKKFIEETIKDIEDHE